ncbi:RNA 2'-phosphotransferase [Streptomyces sp. AJS327]|uniref:RNA 2'-phosphotransferase n=1 Tax=Streptomyces sp. AJS327 TaxID=2545265 RepID=UPI0015E0377C|nr:RNA 2'-phosphotransferase [Streptomyces sp. AJS327]MBA0052746.1 RNA 2'-phosphotransferase [Streptomyces sp. AJS327]
MNDQRTVRISRFLSRHLRHQPERLGLHLDPAGWVAVDHLIAAATEHGFRFSREELEHVVASNDKRRFTLSGEHIRANQGHSVPVELNLPPREPPEWLYHGTVPRALEAIRAEGLRPMNRHAVHLSPDRETARQVGARRGRPVVLSVHAGRMSRGGHTFQRSTNGVWLTEAVPPRFLHWPASPGSSPDSASGSTAPADGSDRDPMTPE